MVIPATMQRLIDFILNMEAARWRALLATLLLLGGIVAVFAFGKSQLALGAEAQLEAWLGGFRVGPWALGATVIVFAVSALLGVPQFILIAACVVAFGPWYGFVFSWLATIISAALTYWMGRGPAARALERLGSRTVSRMKRFVGRNAFSASFIIRNVPSAPFIVVNMAFGAARADFVGFIAGCSLGILPKTALVAFFGGSFMAAVEGDGVWTSLILAGVAFAWLAVMLVVRELVRRRGAERLEEGGAD